MSIIYVQIVCVRNVCKTSVYICVLYYMSIRIYNIMLYLINDRYSFGYPIGHTAVLGAFSKIQVGLLYMYSMCIYVIVSICALCLSATRLCTWLHIHASLMT